MSVAALTNFAAFATVKRCSHKNEAPFLPRFPALWSAKTEPHPWFGVWLSTNDRSRRFHALINDEAILIHGHCISFDSMILAGAFDPQSGRLDGLAERPMDWADRLVIVELSASVDESWRRCVLPDR